MEVGGARLPCTSALHPACRSRPRLGLGLRRRSSWSLATRRPLLRSARLLLFLVRGLDGLAARFSQLLNREFVFVPAAAEVQRDVSSPGAPAVIEEALRLAGPAEELGKEERWVAEVLRSFATASGVDVLDAVGAGGSAGAQESGEEG